MKNDVAIGGASGRFDYFSDYSYFTTDNDVPNNEFTNRTYAGRFGVALGHGTDLSGTIRRADTKYGSPNAILFYAVPDDSKQTGRLHVRRRRRPVADQRPVAEHDPVRLDGAEHALHQPVADRPAVRSLRVRRQLPRRHGDHHGRQRLRGDRAGDSRLSAGSTRRSSTATRRATRCPGRSPTTPGRC